MNFANIQLSCFTLPWLMACWDLRKGSLTRLLSGFAPQILRRSKLVHCHWLWSQLNPPQLCLIHWLYVPVTERPDHRHLPSLRHYLGACRGMMVSPESSVMIQKGFSHGISGDGVAGNSSIHAAHLLTRSYPWQSQQVLFQCLLNFSTLLLCAQRMSCLMPDTSLI